MNYVRVFGPNIKHYKNLGYDVKANDVICVPVEHLPLGARSEVKLTCDICGKEYSKPYKRYVKQHTYDLDTCSACKSIKSKQTCIEKYGVENVFQVDEFKTKQKESCMQKYGCEHFSQTDMWKEKYEGTMFDRYGETNPMKVDGLKEKQRNSVYENYGVYNPLQSKEIQEKVILTNIDRYGFKNPLQNPNVKQKQIETFYKNVTTPTSSQQLKIYNLIQQKYPSAELNYPFSRCSLDIFVCIDEIKIDIEYDGSYWHRDQQCDIRRDKFLRDNGFKILRIRSSHKIPTEKELFSSIEYLLNTDCCFKELILSDWNTENICKEVSA